MFIRWTLALGLAVTFICRAFSQDPAQGQVFTRFEYKHSFKGPHLVDRKNRVPFWTSLGNALPSSDQVRLTPSIRSMKGSIWNNVTFEGDNWEVEVTLRVSGRGSVGGDGMAIWFRDQLGEEGPVFGVSDKWVGMGLILDSFDNDGGMDNPMVSVILNDGTKMYDHNSDGRTNLHSQCRRDFRNRPHPVRLRIRYYQRELKVEYDHGNSAEPVYELCLMSSDVQLPRTGVFGVSAATGGLADDHDVLRFLTWTLSPTAFAHAEAPSMKKEEVDKAQDMYDTYSESLEKQKLEFRKSHPESLLPDDFAFESPYDRSVRQILSGITDVVELTKNLHTAVTSGAVQARGSSNNGQAPPAPNVVGLDAMISQSLSRLTQDVQQVLKRNQEETNLILRAHGDSIRRLQAPSGVPPPVGVAGQADVSQLSGDLSAIRSDIQGQQRQVQAVLAKLTSLADNQPRGAAAEVDQQCVSYTTVAIVAVVEALIAIVVIFVQKKKAAAAEKKFF